MNIQTSHIEQYKYPHNTNISNEPIIERALHQKGSGEELKQNKDTRVTGIGKRKAGKKFKRKRERSDKIKKYVHAVTSM